MINFFIFHHDKFKINLKFILKFLKRKLVLYIKEAVFSNINIILDEKNLGN